MHYCVFHQERSSWPRPAPNVRGRTESAGAGCSTADDSRPSVEASSWALQTSIKTRSRPRGVRGPSRRLSRAFAPSRSVPARSAQVATSYAFCNDYDAFRGRSQRQLFQSLRSRASPLTQRGTQRRAAASTRGMHFGSPSASRIPARARIHETTSSSIHATTFVEMRVCLGNSPRRSKRQMVDRDRPVRSRISGNRTKRSGGVRVTPRRGLPAEAEGEPLWSAPASRESIERTLATPLVLVGSSLMFPSGVFSEARRATRAPLLEHALCQLALGLTRTE